MKANTLGGGQQFSLSGICPYPDCARPSVFTVLTSVNVGVVGVAQRTVAVMQCQGCRSYLLAVVEHPQNQAGNYVYKEHYPIGAPNQDVAIEIPNHIQEDFKEALRCFFVNAYNATAEMCRRAIESACLDLRAPHNKVLEKMIDWLEEERIITPYLKDAAHKVRLGGNRGAHPPATLPATPATAIAAAVEAYATQPIEKIEKEHAEAIVEFTREFFHHVYVGPKLLGKYDFSKPKPPAPTNP
jgi:hypothetical protein